MRIRKRWPPPPPLLVPPPDVLSSTPQVSQPPLQPSVTGYDLRLLEHLQAVKVSNISGWDCLNHNNYSKAKSEGSSDRHRYSNEEPPTPAGEEESTSKDNKFSATKQNVGWYNQKSAAETETETETSPTSYISSSLSHFGSWSEEEKAFPLKKRRASFIRLMLKNEATRKQEKEEMGKKSTSGAIANNEGRCGRSNGKKWRCWQSALEGNAQCEYHLNQERVRNVKRICKQRQAARMSGKAEKVLETSLYSEDEFNSNGDDEDYDVGFEVDKVGLVKARSITSFY
ncbi:uncharacterized protein LOC142609377 isoform X1 [Castanea sativa]|uniref:uncharacterized protein LOC142609377 isoform X1 n=1 Tax=Castanea sativa TaxID=21020 RepID=UPI003F6549F9